MVADFMSRNTFLVLWFKTPLGEIKSFRFEREGSGSKIRKLEKSGFKLIEDPFKKGGKGLGPSFNTGKEEIHI